MVDSPYQVGYPAEELSKYCPGGYYPTHLGDVYKAGRYRVIHKLGWGGYSTVWLARDQHARRNVALKIHVSDVPPVRNELATLQHIEQIRINGASPSIVGAIKLLDEFRIQGPNGIHQCIVTELLGPSISMTLAECDLPSKRLSARWARRVARQLLTTLGSLHQHGIAHGDVHTNNIVFKDEAWDYLEEEELMTLLEEVDLEEVTRKDGLDLEPGIPRYIVQPTSMLIDTSTLEPPEIRLIDFGESFTPVSRPSAVNTPLVLRAPELVFEDNDFSHRIDLWSAGCTIFELFTADPPFDSLTPTKEMLIEQMVEEIGPLPERWAAQCSLESREQIYRTHTLEDRLRRTYLDEPLGERIDKAGGQPQGEQEPGAKNITVILPPRRTPELGDEDLEALGRIVRMLMRYEPADRVPADVVSQESWLSTS